MTDSVKCRYCKGGGLNYYGDGTCRGCAGSGQRPAPRKKLSSITSVEDWLIALDHAEDCLVDTSISAESTPESECAYLVGAPQIVQALAVRLPHFIVRLDTQKTPGSKGDYYFRPVFRRAVLVHCLQFLLGKETDVAHHLRCLDVRYPCEGRLNHETGRRSTPLSRKRWRLWTKMLPRGYQLA